MRADPRKIRVDAGGFAHAFHLNGLEKTRGIDQPQTPRKIVLGERRPDNLRQPFGQRRRAALIDALEPDPQNR